MNETYLRIEPIKQQIRDLKLFVRKYEDDENYREYVEGILDAAISVLGIIRP